MHRSSYPAEAFGYVSASGDVRLLLHHDPSKVKSGREHDTVDPLLLMLALELVDSIPVAGPNAAEVREDARRHLQMHANVILYTDPDTAGLPIALHDKLRDFAFFKANLSGTGEVPPVTTNGRGILYAMYDKRTRELSWFGYHLDLSGRETAAHFHLGRGGKVGDIVIPVSTGSPKEGSVVLSEELSKALFEGNLFFNVHSENFPAGEIRGQVIPAATSRSNNKQIVPPDSPPRQPSPGEQIRPAELGPADANPGPGKVIRPPSENSPKGQINEAVQTEPDSSGRTDGGPDVAKPPSEAAPKADVRQPTMPGDEGSVYAEETLPAGTAVRPGIQQAEKVPGEDVHDDSEMRPPAEKDPSPDVRQTEKQGEHGAVYNNMMPHDDDKKKRKKKGETGHRGGYANRLDHARPLVNVVVDPDQQPMADETVRKVMETDTPTGVESPPKVVVSNLSDPSNAPLRETITDAKRPREGDKPGEGSIRIRDRVVSLLSEQRFRGRVVIFPVIGREGEFLVYKIESAPRPTKFTNDLPDSSFAVIERGGKKDEGGRTTPRSYRHLPYKDASGKIDMPHLRNALARMNQVKAVSPKDSTERIRRVARSVLVRAAREHLPSSKFAKSSQFGFRSMMEEVDVAICERAMSRELPAEAQLMEVREESSRKLFMLKMGDKDNPSHFLVHVSYDGEGNARWVEFDFDTMLPARVAEDFAKFLKSLPVKKE